MHRYRHVDKPKVILEEKFKKLPPHKKGSKTPKDMPSAWTTEPKK